MIKFILKNLFSVLKTLFAFLIMYSCSNKFVANKNDKVNFNDLVFIRGSDPILTQKIDFYIEDTIVKSNICVKGNGSFHVKDSIEANPEYVVSHQIQKNDTVWRLTEEYVYKNEAVIILHSYFPRLLTNDSSIINHYDFDINWEQNYYYEIEYSNILNSLSEPKIDMNTLDTIIRITIPCENSFYISTDEKESYTSIRLCIKNGRAILFSSRGEYDSEANFNLIEKDSCILSQKNTKKTLKYLSHIDFKKEHYFTEIGEDVAFKYLIEIKIGNNYYVFEREWHNKYGGSKQLLNVSDIITHMSLRYLGIKVLY